MKNYLYLMTISLVLMSISYTSTSCWDQIKRFREVPLVTDAHSNENINFALTFLMRGFLETGPCLRPTRIKYVKKILDKQSYFPQVINDIIISYFCSTDDVVKEFSTNQWFMFEEHIGKPSITSTEKTFKTSEAYKKHLANGFITETTTFKEFISACLFDLRKLADLGHAYNPYQFRRDKQLLQPFCNYCERRIGAVPRNPPDLLLNIPIGSGLDFPKTPRKLGLKLAICKYCNNRHSTLCTLKFSQYPKLLIVMTETPYELTKYDEHINSKKSQIDTPFKLLSNFSLYHYLLIIKTSDSHPREFSEVPTSKPLLYLNYETKGVYRHQDKLIEDILSVGSLPPHNKATYGQNVTLQATLYHYTGPITTSSTEEA